MEQWHNYTIKLLNLYEQRHQREIEQLITIFSANQLDTSLPKNSQKLEEIDEFYFSAYCKLYRFDKFLKEYIELGFGEIKVFYIIKHLTLIIININFQLNKEKNSCGFRVLMENTKSGQKYADFWVTERLSVNMKQRIPTVYSWKCRVIF